MGMMPERYAGEIILSFISENEEMADKHDMEQNPITPKHNMYNNILWSYNGCMQGGMEVPIYPVTLCRILYAYVYVTRLEGVLRL